MCVRDDGPVGGRRLRERERGRGIAKAREREAGAGTPQQRHRRRDREGEREVRDKKLIPQTSGDGERVSEREKRGWNVFLSLSLLNQMRMDLLGTNCTYITRTHSHTHTYARLMRASAVCVSSCVVACACVCVCERCVASFCGGLRVLIRRGGKGSEREARKAATRRRRNA